MNREQHPLRTWRKARSKKVTLTDLARRVGVVPSHLSQVETGKRGVSLKVAAALARETGIPISAFVRAA